MRRITGITCLLLATVLFSGCQKTEEITVPALAEPVSVNVDTCEVVRDDIYQIQTYDGQIVPVTTDVVAEYSGILGEVLVREGDYVEEGALIARLSDTAVQAQLASMVETIDQTKEQNRLSNEIAECDIELLKLDLEELESAGEPDETRILQVKYQLEEAELLLEQQQETQALNMERLEEQKQALEAQIVDCDIVAPASGRVAYLSTVQEGQMLLEGSTLAVIASEEELQLRTDFLADGSLTNCDARYIYYGGEEIPVEPLAYSRNDYVSAILRNGSFYRYYTMEKVPDAMEAGDYAQLRIITNRVEQTLVVPVNSLYRDSDGHYVYRIDENGSRIKTPVAVGVRNDVMAEITDGLAEGDEVYVKN